MRIPNKFNGYSRDGIRLYNDPATATITIASMGEGAAIASSLGAAGLLGTVGTGMVGAGAAAALANPLLAGVQAGIGAYGGVAEGGGLASLLSAPTTTALSPEIAANLAAANAPAGFASMSPAQAAIQTAATGTPEVASFQNLANTQGNILNTIAPQTAPPVAPPVVQTPVTPVQPTVESSFLNPNNATPADFKLASPTTTPSQGSGMTGNTFADLKTLASKPNWENIKAFAGENPYTTAAGAYGLYNLINPKQLEVQKASKGHIRPYENTQVVNPNVDYYRPYSGGSTAERNYFTGGLQALPIYRAAEGGLTSLAVGGPVEQMSAMNSTGGNTMYPQANLQTPMYSNPMMQRPVAQNVVNQGIDTNVDPYTGEERMAVGGVADLGDYSDGGRLLKGPGDGVSDSIPASIGNRKPARLADGEFVIPARVVSEIGNGSTEAGARKLYAMMDRVQGARKKTVGKNQVAVNSKADRHLPA